MDHMNQMTMECFYPINSCGSVVAGGYGCKPGPPGRPPRNDRHRSSSKKKKEKKRKERKSTDVRSKAEKSQSGKSNSRSKGKHKDRKSTETVDLSSTVKTIEKQDRSSSSSSSRSNLTKRIGAAYTRTDASIITNVKEETKSVATSAVVNAQDEHTHDGSEGSATCSTRLGSSSSSSSSTTSSSSAADECTHSMASMTMDGDDDGTMTKNSVITGMLENASVTTDNVANVSGPYSWFQPTLHKRFMSMKNGHHRNRQDIKSDESVGSTSSVGAVKQTIKSKFDYIRKTQQFSNYLDPPSDQSIRTSISVKAEDAESLLLKRNRNKKIANKMKNNNNYNNDRYGRSRSRRSELAKQILQRRNATSTATSAVAGGAAASTVAGATVADSAAFGIIGGSHHSRGPLYDP